MRTAVTGFGRQSESAVAVRFFCLAAASAGVAGVLASLLIGATSRPQPTEDLVLPPPFWASTALLLAGSAALHAAWFSVRRERQTAFRRWLFAAVGIGTAFVGVQIYGLWYLVHSQLPSRAETDANAFALVFAACHGIHFVVAMLFVTYVTVNALADRYDHEYYWGVTVCTCFWHVLGVAWVLILCVFAIVV